MRFYLGTHEPTWLARTSVPLFISARRLRNRKRLPRAIGTWALDSGAFTELTMYGTWKTDPETFASEAKRYAEEIGNMMWAAPQDWPCEPAVIEGGQMGKLKVPGTKLSVCEHQRKTIENWLLLRKIAPGIPFIPVLQGWHYEDYLSHLGQWYAAGAKLHCLATVGLGSVCRRQDTDMVEQLIRELRMVHHICIHAFGFKMLGLARASRWLASADSLAWSLDARHGKPLPGCKHKNCANCMNYALLWRNRVLDAAQQGQQRQTQRRLFA